MDRKHKKAVGIMQLRKQTFLNKNTPFTVKEAYKVVRTNIMFSVVDKGCKIIAITSSFPEEGKTTTCTNLALSFAEMGKRVLIIDGDLRKPQIHNLFGLDNQVGISNVLAGFASITEAIKIVHDYDIHVMTAGSIPPNPAELLGGERMKRIVEEIKTAYDYVFIDTPPVNVVTDVVALSPYVSGIILVVKEGKTNYRDIDQSRDKLKFVQTKILGMVLTGRKVKRKKYGMYNKYGKNSSYRSYLNYE